jgi:hypothetical protein
VSHVVFANTSAISAAPVVFVLFLAVVILLCVRATSRVMHLPLTRFVSQMLDGSTLVITILFFILVVIRFKTIG